ncbi:radical SAM family heme chaperone HemW [Magnetospirillum molischianum]|uniref:Heme chaperone HemW n=1 Tax=Magnetospirillum molischianum DSM 120 TaxID=1150626 RepID=H8FTU2_MAGML|nr:radical SAM family heme chaperone HemW [Magnetospirillum molischianum]CCG41799.1 putative oxygen-independent coproporphyrinogen III oxidase (yggW) [Magnetospirillum molischianum DSM 120]
MAAEPDAGFGLYVHWPFCRSKCPYCDFNSRPAGAIDQPRWAAALLAELDYFADRTPGRRPTSLFFGGGTPSLLDPEIVSAIVTRVRARWDCAPDWEVSLESNPDSADAGRFQAYRDGGVTRLSLGLQALDDTALRWLGRPHDVAEGRAALELARTVFPRLSFDLIHSRPGQSLAAWRDELALALTFAPDHLSLYQLTIEDGTVFGARGVEPPDDDTGRALLDLTRAMTAAVGLPAYEVSNHARPGAECRHNLTYWRGGDWVGIGPGAHGRLGVAAIAQNRDPDTWLAAVETIGHGTETEETLSPESLAAERVMMGLRLAAGIDIGALAAGCGLAVEQVIDRRGLARLIEAGLVESDGDRLRATPDGWPLLDSVLAMLLV